MCLSIKNTADLLTAPFSLKSGLCDSRGWFLEGFRLLTRLAVEMEDTVLSVGPLHVAALLTFLSSWSALMAPGVDMMVLPK